MRKSLPRAGWGAPGFDTPPPPVARGQACDYRRGARHFHFKTAAEAVSKATELVQAGIPNVTITDLTSGRVYRQDELSLLQAEARMRFERGSH